MSPHSLLVTSGMHRQLVARPHRTLIALPSGVVFAPSFFAGRKEVFDGFVSVPTAAVGRVDQLELVKLSLEIPMAAEHLRGIVVNNHWKLHSSFNRGYHCPSPLFVL